MGLLRQSYSKLQIGRRYLPQGLCNSLKRGAKVIAFGKMTLKASVVLLVAENIS